MSFLEQFTNSLGDGTRFDDILEFGLSLKDIVVKALQDGAGDEELLEALQHYRAVVASEDHEDVVLDIMDYVHYSWLR